MGGFPKNGRPRPQQEVRRYTLPELLPRSLPANGLVCTTYPIVDPEDETVVVAAGMVFAFYQGTDLIGVPIRLELEADGFERVRPVLNGGIDAIIERLTEGAAEEGTGRGRCSSCGTAVFGERAEKGLCVPCETTA